MIIAGNIMIALGEGTFGILVLGHHPHLWQMVMLETLTGTGIAMFYPASQALLPMLVPGELLRQASAVSRLVMNAAQMAGAAFAGVFVAVAGPGRALAACGIGMARTVPLLLSIRAGARAPGPRHGMAEGDGYRDGKGGRKTGTGRGDGYGSGNGDGRAGWVARGTGQMDLAADSGPTYAQLNSAYKSSCTISAAFHSGAN